MGIRLDMKAATESLAFPADLAVNKIEPRRKLGKGLIRNPLQKPLRSLRA